MTDYASLIRFGELLDADYIPSVGAWVQIDKDAGLTSILNAFNTLGEQTIELFMFNQAGDSVGETFKTKLATNETLRLDLEDLLPAGTKKFEGAIWLWCKGADSEGSIGLQAIDLDFVDRNLPKGFTLGSVHIIFDFLNTLNIAPWLDLVSPRVMVGKTKEGGPRFRNYLGLAHIPINDGSDEFPEPELVVTIANQEGETKVAAPIKVPILGSVFVHLESLFPDMPDFLMGDGTSGYGSVGVRDKNSNLLGLASMIKVVDVQSGSMLVNHLNDRNFARPAMKDG